MALSSVTTVIFFSNRFTAGAKNTGILRQVPSANMSLWNPVVGEQIIIKIYVFLVIRRFIRKILSKYGVLIKITH